MTGCATGGVRSPSTRPAAERVPSAASKPASIPCSASAESASAESACSPASCVACAERVERLAETSTVAAQTVLSQCLVCPTATPAVYLLAADLHDESNDSAGALRVLRDGTARFPLNATLWEALSRAALGAGHRSTALDAMTTAHHLRPDDRRLAAAYRALMARHGSALERATHQVDALILEASGRYELGDTVGAYSTLNDALERAKDTPSLRAKVRHRLGLLALAQARLDDAAVLLAKAREDAGDDVALRADIDLARAELALARGDYSSAQSAAESTIAGRPTDPLAHVNLALARAHGGDAAGGVEALTAAFRHGLPSRITRNQVVALVASAPWGPDRSRVDALIDQAWPTAE